MSEEEEETVDVFATYFEILEKHEETRRKVRGHDTFMEEVRAVKNASPAAVEFLENFRGESAIAIPLLAGTLPPDSLAHQWACCAYTVGPNVGAEWEDWQVGEMFAKWLAFSETESFEPTVNLAMDDGLFERWSEMEGSYEGPTGVLQIGSLAGGDYVWALPNGEVWMASVEWGEVPFLKLFDDLGSTVSKFVSAYAADEITCTDGVWVWGDRTYHGADIWT